MKIPLKAKVICKDGEYGSIKELLIDPIKEKATHIVVENKHSGLQVIIPVDVVDYSSDSVINIDNVATKIDKYPPFIIHEFIKVSNSEKEALYWGVDPIMNHTYTMFPYVIHDGKPTVEIRKEAVPKGSFKLRKGMHVIDTNNKKIGKVDELIVERESDLISHIVMRTGHLFGGKEVAVPNINISSYNADNIVLSIEDSEVNALPEVVIKRAWK